MLDQADFIARYDKEDALGVMGHLPEQLRHEFPKLKGLPEAGEITSIVLAGMGGSAQPGEFIKTWLGGELKLPFVIVRDYALPAFVGPNTLVVASSYSGNTEETLAALAEAESRQAKIVVMTAGGKLLEAAKAKGYPALVLPSDFQPRMSGLYAVRALSSLLEQMGLASRPLADLAEAGEWLKGEIGQWAANVPAAENSAKQLASELVGYPVVMYAGSALAFAAMRWKICINEDAKNIAFWNVLPEMNHNEFSGWGHPPRTRMKVIELISTLDNPQVTKRFVEMNALLSNRIAPIEIQVQGETKLQQILWSYVLGGMVSVYLGVLNQVEIGALPMVDKLKQRLK